MAVARRNDVLRKMAEVGFITRAQSFAAIRTPLELHSNGYFQQKRESYFFDYVTDELIKRYDLKTVRSGGLTIKTTIDLDLQRKARDSIAKDLSFAGAPSSAIVTIDPSNGYILTMASSAKYENSKFNLAAQGKRQPGSTFKIMALVAAVRMGINPATTHYASGPLPLPPIYGDNVVIKCYGGKCRGGSPNLVEATLRSDNTVYVRLAMDIGPKKVVQAAQRSRHHLQARRLPVRDARRPRALLLAAGDGQRLRDDRLRRLAQQAQGDHRGELPRRQGRRSLQAAAPQGLRLRCDVRGHEDPRAEHQVGHRRPRGDRLPGGRQDRHDRPELRRLVRRLHAEARDRCVGRLPEGRASRWATSSAAGRSTAARSRRRSGAAT